jgi:type VI secretion system secreted protein Hcp
VRTRALVFCLVLVSAFPLLGADPQAAVLAEPVGQLHFEGQPVEVYSWSFGVTQTLAGTDGGGAAAGKVQMQDFHFTKTVDKSSVQLFQACATGKHIPNVTFTARKKGSGQQEYMIVKFSDVLVSSYQTGGSSGDSIPTESISLNYAKIEFFVPGH